MKKIQLQDKKECWVCGTTIGLHHHECLFGSANRKKSIDYGLQVWLCGPHHNLSKMGVHHNHMLDLMLKQLAQRKFEEVYSHEQWMEEFHKNYL
jgi:hypothetical protein